MKKIYLLLILFLSIGVFAQTFTRSQEIFKNAKYYSPSQNYYMLFQNDGNLVIYNARNNSAVWDSKTKNSGKKAIFQKDGNLVIYGGFDNAVFTTNTIGRGNRLNIQDDGNLVIYGAGNIPIWSSLGGKPNNVNSNNYLNNTVNAGYRFSINEKLYSTNRNYFLVFQQDGNLVINDKIGAVLWNSKTANRGVKAEFQRDGNLVVYDRKGAAIYATQSGGRNGRTLMMQDDGNLVIYGMGKNTVWASDDDHQ